jgi:hypothetical protein
LGRGIVGLAVELLNFFRECGAVVALRVGGKEIGLPLVIPIVRVEALGLLEMRDGIRAVTFMIEIFGEAEFGVGHEAIRTGGSEALAEFVFFHDERAAIAVRNPIADSVEVRRGIKVREGFEAVVRKSDFGRADDSSLLINPDAGGDVYQAVELSDEVLLVNQNSEIGMGSGDPGAGVANSAGILSDAEDLKIFAA